MILFASVVRNISLIIFSLKSAGKVQPCALARARSSSKTSDTSCLTPTFSISAGWDGVSKITLKGWNEMGLYINNQHGVFKGGARPVLTRSSSRTAVAVCSSTHGIQPAHYSASLLVHQPYPPGSCWASRDWGWRGPPRPPQCPCVRIPRRPVGRSRRRRRGKGRHC